MGRKLRSTATLSLEPSHMSALLEIAKEHDMIWGSKPNISKLLRAIAEGDLVVVDSKKEVEEHLKDYKLQMLRKLRFVIDNELETESITKLEGYKVINQIKFN